MGSPMLVSALLSMFLLTSPRVSGYYDEPLLGGLQEVKDVKHNVEVQTMGSFAVKEFNRRRQEYGNMGGGELMFSEVVEAMMQVVSGAKYLMNIEVMQNGEVKMFYAEVWDQPWRNHRELLKFSPSKGMRVKK